MKRKTQNKRSKCGMTIIEVVVFMSLAFMVLAGSFPVVTQLRISDKVHEERLAAFLFVHKELEELKARPYAVVTDGFAELANGNYKKVNSVSFYKNVSGEYKILLKPRTNANFGDYYLVEMELSWDTTINGIPKRKNTRKETFFILSDV